MSTNEHSHKPEHQPADERSKAAESAEQFTPETSLDTTLQHIRRSPRDLPPQEILRLQRTVGNRATSQLLKVGTPDSEAAESSPEAPAFPVISISTNHARRGIQRDYHQPTTDPTHPALVNLGVANLGPYRFKPMQGIFEYQLPDAGNVPTYLSVLKQHMNVAVNFPAEQIAPVAAGGYLWTNVADGSQINFHPGGVTPASQADRIAKATTAYNASPGSAILAAMRLFNNGNAPRAFTGVAAEDAIGAADNCHIMARHVVGGADMPDATAVAVRAAFGIIGGINGRGAAYSPVASAFATAGDADAEILAALVAHFIPNWNQHRLTLIAGNNVELTVARAGRPIVAYRSVAGAALADTEKPAYLGGGLLGKRPLFYPNGAWDGWAGAQGFTDKKLDGLKKFPITTDISGQLPNIHIRIIPTSQAGTGGWVINSAYPTD